MKASIMACFRGVAILGAQVGWVMASSGAATSMKSPTSSVPDRWTLQDGLAIRWDVAAAGRIPHQDHIEMSGQGVSLILRYGVDPNGCLILNRQVVWPSLRIFPNNTHGSLSHEYGLGVSPRIKVNGAPISTERPRRFTLEGLLTIDSSTAQGLDITRVVFPCTELRAAMERWTLCNASAVEQSIEIESVRQRDLSRGPHGVYILEVSDDAPPSIRLEPGATCVFGVTFGGRRANEKPIRSVVAVEEEKRRAFVTGLVRSLRLESPDTVLNRAFDFAKIRAAESVFATRGGLMHGPGGGAYYAAVWCNDQVEYAGPFFPFLGNSAANEASLNAYRLYTPFMGPDYKAIPSSIIAEGLDLWEGAGDRGDAAMYAYGASRFALALGDRRTAEELYPAIAWCLEYCRRQMTPEGVIVSKSDELEGRFPSGKANLSTSALTYGGLRSTADLARELGKPSAGQEYDRRADALARSIELYFGTEVEGFRTYRYYKENRVLRSWICLPLTMGILDRREGTIAALFSPRLWTVDGLATQAGDKTFWDRSTLYGLRGVFCAGQTEKALSYFQAYTRRRLLGEHVPYAVEAYPEGNQRHLSAESALYCRVVTEGVFGIVPAGLRAFRCTPRLPRSWNAMALRSIRAFGSECDLYVDQQGGGLRVGVMMSGKIIVEKTVADGQSAVFQLP